MTWQQLIGIILAVPVAWFIFYAIFHAIGYGLGLGLTHGKFKATNQVIKTHNKTNRKDG